MKRRSFLAVLMAAGAAAATWPGLAGAWSRPDPAARLLATLRHRQSAAAVGRAFLERYPAEADARGLATTLCDDLRGRRCDPARAGRGALRQAVSEQVRADFAAGRTVQVQGWVLSATEARLCGLAALA